MRLRAIIVGLATASGILVAAQPALAQSTVFEYTGAAQTFTVPTGVTRISVVVCGAQGRDVAEGRSGGRGGCATALLTVIPGETLHVNVGGQGGFPGMGTGGSGGWNGGAPGGGSTGVFGLASGGGGGGGASDVSRAGTRLVVGGGGGGGGVDGYEANLGGVGGSGGGDRAAPAVRSEEAGVEHRPRVELEPTAARQAAAGREGLRVSEEEEAAAVTTAAAEVSPRCAQMICVQTPSEVAAVEAARASGPSASTSSPVRVLVTAG